MIKETQIQWYFFKFNIWKTGNISGANNALNLPLKTLKVANYTLKFGEQFQKLGIRIYDKHDGWQAWLLTGMIADRHDGYDAEDGKMNRHDSRVAFATEKYCLPPFNEPSLT